MMDWKLELIMVGQVVLACFLGSVIGWEREQHGQTAGIRTFAAIAIGSCVFGLISIHASGPNVDITRIAAQVVSGVGFLGAGVIFRKSSQGETVSGLTTAATFWSAAAVGLAVSFHMYIIAILTAFLIFLMLLLPKLSWWRKISRKRYTAS